VDAQRLLFVQRLDALKRTLEGYKASASAGRSVTIRRSLVSSRDAASAARRHEDLRSTLTDCKRLAQRHLAARGRGAAAPPAASPFSAASSPATSQLEEIAAAIGLTSYLDAPSGGSTATMTLSSEAILVDVAMSLVASEDPKVDSVTVQLMRDAVTYHEDELTKMSHQRRWVDFRRRLGLILQTATLAAIAAQASPSPAGSVDAGTCLSSVCRDIRQLISKEREMQLANQTTAVERMLRGHGLLEEARPVPSGTEPATQATHAPIKALWVYSEPAAFVLGAEDTGSTINGEDSTTNDERSLRHARSTAAMAVRVVLGLERTVPWAGAAGGGGMQCESWISSVSASAAGGRGPTTITDVVYRPERATAAAANEVREEGRLTVSAQLLEPIIMAPSTLAALQALGALGNASTDGGMAVSSLKRKRDANAATESGTAAQDASLSEMLLPPATEAAAATGEGGCVWDVTTRSPALTGGDIPQRFVSDTRGRHGSLAGIRVSRLLCCANVEMWGQTVALLRQQATWNTLCKIETFSICARAFCRLANQTITTLRHLLLPRSVRSRHRAGSASGVRGAQRRL